MASRNPHRAVVARACAVGLVLAGALLGGCAALDAAAVAQTHRLDDAPYVVDLARDARPPGDGCAVALPVGVDPELREAIGYGGRLARLQPIVAALDARLAAHGGCLATTAAAPRAPQPPHVYVGVSEGELAPPQAADQRVPHDRFAPMVLHFERPCTDWQREAAGLAAAAGKPYVLAIQLGVGQYAKGYASAFRKEVVLGTNHRQPIRFLTTEGEPVEVLHLTGVLLDATGRPVRAGAEGILLRDTPFLAQTLGLRRVLDDVTLDRVLEDERREDLPGRPLKLDAALDQLVHQLLR